MINKNNNKKHDRIGITNLNNYGSKMTIIEYNNCHSITVKFDNGYIVHTNYYNFEKGNVQNPYDKSVLNVGFLGEGKYKSGITEGKHAIQYEYWRGMLRRCFDEKWKEKHPSYKDVTCCNEWLCFQNFATWFDENYYNFGKERLELDKDILHKGNKIYNPIDCIFAPKTINTLFIQHKNKRNNLPIGVCLTKQSTKFQSKCMVRDYNKKRNKKVYLGLYNTPEEAFEVYKQFKEQYIKQIADEYKDKIPKKLYDAMYRYEVEITD